MRRRQASELIKLVHGEGGVMWPSLLERRLLKFSLDTFGEMLSQFLLTGLGKQKMGQRWNIATSYISEEGAMRKRHVQVITYEPASGESCLPRGRDPLVLLALLRLLLNRHQAKSILLYSHEEVLKLLGWKDFDETRQEVDKAVDRYSLLMYLWEKRRDELAGTNHSHYKAREHMISEYETTNKEAGANGEMKRVANRLIFNDYFIGGLLRRSLFDVDWNKARSIKHISFPIRRR